MLIRTEDDLRLLIDRGIEESSTLEYKAAKALNKGAKQELTKDVSSFANATGGTIVYGISESSSSKPPRLPESIDPVDASVISTEWLDQIIGQIQPRIRGVTIHPIRLSSSRSDVAYVVEIPPGETAHQSLDCKYYVRRNFESTPMEDYEIRDRMNRIKDPRMAIGLSLVRQHNSFIVNVTLRNIGPRLVKNFQCQVYFPHSHASTKFRPLGNGYGLMEGPPQRWKWVFGPETTHPVFPGSEVYHHRVVSFAGGQEGDPPFTSEIIIKLFADEAAMVTLKANASEAFERCVWSEEGIVDSEPHLAMY